jgi:hypothetical protein
MLTVGNDRSAEVKVRDDEQVRRTALHQTIAEFVGTSVPGQGWVETAARASRRSHESSPSARSGQSRPQQLDAMRSPSGAHTEYAEDEITAHRRAHQRGTFVWSSRADAQLLARRGPTVISVDDTRLGPRRRIVIDRSTPEANVLEAVDWRRKITTMERAAIHSLTLDGLAFFSGDYCVGLAVRQGIWCV